MPHYFARYADACFMMLLLPCRIAIRYAAVIATAEIRHYAPIFAMPMPPLLPGGCRQIRVYADLR